MGECRYRRPDSATKSDDEKNTSESDAGTDDEKNTGRSR